jgi:hypothetical protein
MVTTSLNLNPDVLQSICQAAIRMNTTRREVIVRLLAQVALDIDLFPGGFMGVRYQPKRARGTWRCFCIRFENEEYEVFTDLRKISKFSVSFLVAIAVERYLGKMDRCAGGNVNNYTGLPCYTLARKVAAGVTCWMHYWGDPWLLERTNPRETHLRQTGLRPVARNGLN